MGKAREVKVRGVYEKVPGSGEWWIRYADAAGRIRREKVGPKGAAIKLYSKRKTEVLQGNKLPETLRKRVVLFTELAEDALKYCEAHNAGAQFDGYRIGRLKEEFGNRQAELPISDLRDWFAEQEWENGTYNRYKTTLSLIYRLGIENGKVSSNPARLLKRKPEDNARVRFLNQFKPAQTDIEYLKPFSEEEQRLRAVIREEYREHEEEFIIALNTGMRPSEQYALSWDRIDLTRRDVFLPKTKNGNARHIPLNSEALSAFQRLRNRSGDSDSVFVGKRGDPLQGYKHWFDDAVAKAGLKEFTWYCLRHTFASRLVMAGVDIRTVSELMGHKTIQMTMRYAHLAPQHKMDAVERLVAQNGSTDTRTDTSQNREVEVATASSSQVLSDVADAASVGA